MINLHGGDCLDVLKTIPSNSIDSVITDPPYGIKIMGKNWDYDVPGEDVWGECLRVLKPGGHLLSFASARTQHRMTVNIENAGFEIRDMIAWVYGSGFPKSKNLGNGMGTTLKPAIEPITMARKAVLGTITNNVSVFGTGAINIDGCRVPFANELDEKEAKAKNKHSQINHDAPTTKNVYGQRNRLKNDYNPEARFPTNFIHDGSNDVLSTFPQSCSVDQDVADSKTPARFFYCAKASSADRGDGNNHPTVKPTDLMRYLCRLVTPPAGVILDPFMGSGTTWKAALLEGFRFIGIELNSEYFTIAQARLEFLKAQLQRDAVNA